MIVLDTNVVSELMRSAPEPAVLTWLQQTSSTGL
jgi:predicted nucleic acid-binding protein